LKKTITQLKTAQKGIKINLANAGALKKFILERFN
jgi:hypothetical protein